MHKGMYGLFVIDPDPARQSDPALAAVAKAKAEAKAAAAAAAE